MSDELADLRERYARLSLLNQISNVIHSTLDSQEALHVILREAVRAMRDLGADNQQIITALQIAVDEIAKSEGPK